MIMKRIVTTEIMILTYRFLVTYFVEINIPQCFTNKYSCSGRSSRLNGPRVSTLKHIRTANTRDLEKVDSFRGGKKMCPKSLLNYIRVTWSLTREMIFLGAVSRPFPHSFPTDFLAVSHLNRKKTFERQLHALLPRSFRHLRRFCTLATPPTYPKGIKSRLDFLVRDRPEEFIKVVRVQ